MTAASAAASDLVITIRQRNLVVAGVLIGMLVAAINQTSVATAGYTIVGQLHGLDLYTWLFTANMLASSVAVPIFGKLSDMYGRRRLFIAGVSIFLVGAVACGLAQSMEQLIAARAIQGVGMGAIMPLAMAIIADVIPAAERGKWQGIMGAVFGVATVLGPLAGGWVTDHFGWRWIFWGNLPLGVLALVFVVTQLHLPFVRRESRVDWWGAATFAGALVLLLLALNQGGQPAHPWGSAHIVGMLAGSILLLAAFAVVERRAADPMIPLALLAERNVLATSIAGLMVGAGMFASIFFTPLFLQSVAGVSTSNSGLALIPLMLGLITASTVGGIVVTRTGRYRLLMAAGPAVGAVGLWLLHAMTADTGVLDAGWRMVVVGAGIGLVMQNLVLVAQNSVAAASTGVATSLATLTRSLGGTVGTAVLGTIFTSELHDNIGERLERAGTSAAAVGGTIDTQSVLGALEGTLTGPVHEALRLGFSDALLDLFLYSIPFMLVAFVACLLLRADRLSTVANVRVVDELEHELADIVPVDAGHAAAAPLPKPTDG